MDKINCKKGQVTIFVILAVVLIAIIFVLFIVRKNDTDSLEADFDNPQGYISTCLKEKAQGVIEKMLAGGGFVNSNNTILYDSNEITYLCKNINNFEPCINQHPLYIRQVEKEFNNNMKNYGKECFYSLRDDLVSKDYEISGNYVNLESNFKEGIIEIVLNNDLTIKKGDISKKFSRFDTYAISNILGISFVVNEILAQEAKYCHFSNDGFMALYPEYDVRVYMMEDSTKIYTIKNKNSNEILKMAVRGCVMPTGWF